MRSQAWGTLRVCATRALNCVSLPRHPGQAPKPPDLALAKAFLIKCSFQQELPAPPRASLRAADSMTCFDSGNAQLPCSAFNSLTYCLLTFYIWNSNKLSTLVLLLEQTAFLLIPLLRDRRNGGRMEVCLEVQKVSLWAPTLLHLWPLS